MSIWFSKLRLIRVFLSVSMIVFSVLTFFQALSRYVFDLALFGLEDVIMMIAVWMYFFGAAYGAYVREHIVAGLVDTIFPNNDRIKEVIGLFATLLTVLVLFCFSYWSYEYVIWIYSKNAVSSDLKIPRFYYSGSVLAGCFFMSLYFISNIIEDIKNMVRRETRDV